jgi:hypothetical protein
MYWAPKLTGYLLDVRCGPKKALGPQIAIVVAVWARWWRCSHQTETKFMELLFSVALSELRTKILNHFLNKETLKGPLYHYIPKQ